MADPEAFARDVANGNIKARNSRGVGPYPSSLAGDQDEDDQDDGAADGTGQQQQRHQARFEEIPTPQNVVRMPPINWAKYHIVGESLDKLHEEQRVRPVQGQPLRDDDLRPRERGEENVIARPYDPWKDGVMSGEKEKGVRTRSGGKKG